MNDETSPSSRAFDSAPPRSVLRLLVVYSPEGQAEGRAKVLAPEAPILLGRDSSSNIALETLDSRLSRAHCSIERRPNGWHLRDLDSRNGTFHNGTRVSEAALGASDVVRIGNHVLLLQQLNSDEALAILSDRSEATTIEGSSPQLSSLRRRVAALAPLPHPVLILGETGVGKEVVARALHQRRFPGREAPFVAVNCAALAAEIAEAELFGHTKGAFTGATQPRSGLFREADGGTLFLDELGDMPLALQSKLLRALETREIRPVGADRSVPFDARIVAATNRELTLEMSRGNFRNDLFARLMTHVLELPPLRERKDDILPLLSFFQRDAGVATLARPTPDAAEALLAYSWPRNVRELRQLASRWMSSLERMEAITLDHLPEPVRECLRERPNLAPSRLAGVPLTLLEIPRDRAPERAELVAVLAAFEGNITKTAEFFGKDRRQIYRWCERWEIVTHEP